MGHSLMNDKFQLAVQNRAQFLCFKGKYSLIASVYKSDPSKLLSVVSGVVVSKKHPPAFGLPLVPLIPIRK